MQISEQLRVLAAHLNISVAEMARRCGKSPQAFRQKMAREGFTPIELEEIADILGCKYEHYFVLPNGDKV